MSGNKGLSQNIEVDTVLGEYMSIHSAYIQISIVYLI